MRGLQYFAPRPMLSDHSLSGRPSRVRHFTPTDDRCQISDFSAIADDRPLLTILVDHYWLAAGVTILALGLKASLASLSIT